MPLYRIEQQADQIGWAIWHIEEAEEELAFEAFEQCPVELVSSQKRLEWLAARVLIKVLLTRNNLAYKGLVKDEFGKPFLRELPHSISLTHSFPYVAVQIHSSSSVGIDLEQPKAKLLKVGARVLSELEFADAGSDLTKLCIYWCAKEAMYKIYGQRGLHFSNQLNVEPFDLKKEGFLNGVITVNDQKQTVKLQYRVETDFVLVFTNL
jgi:4'-phosphopantetheinyl transferase